MESKYTKGPWLQNTWGHVIDCEGKEVEFEGLTTVMGYNVGVEVKANSKLVASAPELLEALQELLDAYIDHEGAAYCQIGTESETITKAKAAILKATSI